MSSTVERLSWRQASALAYKVECQLRPVCERIQVAGSVRRKAESIGDIEFVITPKREPGLFGDAQPGESLLDVELRRLVEAGKLTPGRCNGERQKNYVLSSSGVSLDLFIVTRQKWGVALALRTGPADFSRSLVTPQGEGAGR